MEMLDVVEKLASITESVFKVWESYNAHQVKAKLKGVPRSRSKHQKRPLTRRKGKKRPKRKRKVVNAKVVPSACTTASCVKRRHCEGD